MSRVSADTAATNVNAAIQTSRLVAGSIELAEVDVAKLIEQLRRVPDVLTQVSKNVMRLGVDYGKIPGTPKPSLWNSGAQLLARFYCLAPEMTILYRTEETDPERPFFDFTIECRLYGKSGFVGSGLGSCNSRESRYAWRWVQESQIPPGVDKSKLQTRQNYDRAQFRVPTPPDEVYTAKNTILKMAEKRAFVDAVLRVTGASRIFTQDVVEEPAPGQSNAAAKAAPQSQPVKSPAKPTTPPTQPQVQSTSTWRDTTGQG